MKRLLSVLPIILFISCGGNNSEEFINKDDKYASGKLVYDESCVACHQKNGDGVEGAFPPLANSDYLLADKLRAVKQIIHGSSGEMTVNGVVYNNIMPPQPLEDQQVVDVTNYILNAWGNKGGEVTLEDVKRAR